MNQYQKKVIFIIFGILILIAVITVIWSLFLDHNELDDPSSSNKPTPPNNNEQVFNEEISLLNDYNEFFTVSRIINNYLLEITSENSTNILQLLDEDYKAEHKINANNIFNILKINYSSASFTPMKIYYNDNSVVTYYFAQGYLEDVDFIENSSLYYDSVNFLVITNKNTKHYAIIPLDNNINIENYAKEYKLVEKELEYNSYSQVETTEEMVLITYLNVFRDLLFLDNERAFSMLSSETSKKYTNKQDFYDHQEDIYEYIPSNVFGFSKKEANDTVIYQINDDERNEFIIYEYGIMNFQISY